MIHPDRWMHSPGLTLEANAWHAIKDTEHSLVLLAGPGAGKTEILAQRADFLLSTGSCRYPKRILAISFKSDASRNLKDRVSLRCGWEQATRFDSFTFHSFANRIVSRFRVLLTGPDVLKPDYSIGKEAIPGEQITFMQLLPMALKILRMSKIARNTIRQTYAHVFLDEFQDCTSDQYQLIKLLFEGTPALLTAVGDTKQTIMGWAGALDGIFKLYADDFAARPLRLYRNFRSKPRLLRMQNSVIRDIDPLAIMPDEMIVGDDGVIRAGNFSSSAAEAVSLANLIQKWIEVEDLRPAEIAVLFRGEIDLYGEELMEQLTLRNIPFRNENSLQDLLKEPAARLMIDYLTCLYTRGSNKAWSRLMDLFAPFDDEGNSDRTHKSFELCYKQHQKQVKAAAKTTTPYADWWELARGFFDILGHAVMTTLSSDYETKRRLKEIIRDTRDHITTLLLTEPDLPRALARFSDDNAVRFLSMHKSKGLEFHSVIISGVEQQTFRGKIGDERQVFFVAVSRAKDRLIITTANQRQRPAGISASKRWDVARQPHVAFVTYVTEHLSPKQPQ